MGRPKKPSLVKKEGDAKRGRLSIFDMDFIRNNIVELGPEKVAEELNRTVETVREFAKKECIAFENFEPDPDTKKAMISNDLKNTPEWEAIREEFNEKELKYFLYKYSEYVQQFKDDVLPTEQSQIFQVVKFEILMNRNLKAVKKATASVRRMEAEISRIIAKYEGVDMPDSSKNFIMSLENQILAARSAMGSRTGEYVKLQEKHSALFKELKATRDQRVSRTENSTKDIFGLLKAMQDPKFREKEGRQQALVKLALEKEKKGLGDYHTYEDGSIDRRNFIYGNYRGAGLMSEEELQELEKDPKNYGKILVESFKRRFEFNQISLKDNVLSCEIKEDRECLKEGRHGWYCWIEIKDVSASKYPNQSNQFGSSIDCTLETLEKHGYKSWEILNIIIDDISEYLDENEALDRKIKNL